MTFSVVLIPQCIACGCLCQHVCVRCQRPATHCAIGFGHAATCRDAGTATGSRRRGSATGASPGCCGTNPGARSTRNCAGSGGPGATARFAPDRTPGQCQRREARAGRRAADSRSRGQAADREAETAAWI